MKYEAKMLKNNTDKKVEFMCAGQSYVFKPGEQRILDGNVAYHALKKTNTGLTDIGADKKEVSTEKKLVSEMSWNDMRKVSDKDGKKLYKMGMSKKELIELIKKNV